MTEYTSGVIESQVDWLTCSAHSDASSDRLIDVGQALALAAELDGNKATAWRSMGFVGQHCGQIDWGRRDRRQAIVRLSGQAAAAYLPAILPLADTVTRLDVAVTWRAVPADPHIGRNAYSLAALWYGEHPRSALPSQTGDAAGGFTCYLGDRRSPYYARLYNKEAERASRDDADQAKHYAGCWRYEVESHDSYAGRLAEAVTTADDPPAFIQEWLYQYWTTHGVPPAFPPSGASALLPGFHRRTDDERRLRHFARNVAPSVRGLVARGREADVRRILGLP